ncbi:MAG: hypothetical protein PHQ40_00370 [Anaerolineaceae bacterium]|nr:hypothetical protein [Anaerolineaceae bacterium]MDD5367510.1 hypothetical protein [Anaerolineaceae bacterium]
MSGTPITITLYDAEDAPIKTFTRSVVPWGILKRAIKMAKQLNTDALDPANLDEKILDELAGLVVTIFGDRFTIDDLDKGADVTDMIAVIEQIVNKAGGLVPNPPPPG